MKACGVKMTSLRRYGRSGWIVRVLAVGTVGVFGAAGLMKAADVYEFSRTLQLWTAIPRPLTPLLAVLVPMVEVGLATAWFARLARRASSFGILGILLLFSLATTWQYVAYEPVPCGCFGGSAPRAVDMGDLVFLLGRNLGAFIVLLLYVVLPFKASTSSLEGNAGAIA